MSVSARQNIVLADIISKQIDSLCFLATILLFYITKHQKLPDYTINNFLILQQLFSAALYIRTIFLTAKSVCMYVYVCIGRYPSYVSSGCVEEIRNAMRTVTIANIDHI